MRLYNSKQTLDLEKKINKEGIDLFMLMLRAGNEIINICKEYKHKKIISVAGVGNNGGDALAATLFGLINSLEIICVDYTKTNTNSIKLKSFLKTLNAIILKNLPPINRINRNYLIIDGLLGIGINREPKGKFLKAIKWMNKAREKGAKIISIDIPSGLNPDSGVAYKNSVNAYSTIMCLTRKKGCYTGDGLKLCGKLHYKELGINVDKYKINNNNFLIKLNENINIKRDNLGYKGTFGNVLIVGGWNGMIGAANLTAAAALKTGAGKVFLCTNNPKNKINEVINIDPKQKNFKAIIKKISVAIVGPGLGNNAHGLIEYIWHSSLPLVLDADALKWLSRNFRKKRKHDLICTPHYGEAVILLKKDFEDRFSAISQLKEIYGGDWILKGPGTLVYEEKLYVNNFANSVLSTAGTGDVLSGIIGALLAQKIKEPAKTGVALHSKCAIEILKKKKKTIIASELINEISYLLNN